MNDRLLLARNHVWIAGLPSKVELRGVALQGCTTLVNVSGASLVGIHGALAVSPFTLHEHLFSDLFSQHDIISDVGQADVGLFKQAFPPEQQQSYLASVSAVSLQLRAHHTVALFCHFGVGRSPAVALGALRCAWGWSTHEAAAVIRQIRPQAHLSALSFSASQAACLSLTSAPAAP